MTHRGVRQDKCPCPPRIADGFLDSGDKFADLWKIKDACAPPSGSRRDDATLASLASHKPESSARLGLRISAGSPSHLVRALGRGRVPASLYLVYSVNRFWDLRDIAAVTRTPG